MISIKQLRYLDAIARFGHFGRAAEHCGVTQPALSMQIRELETDLAVQLVERRTSGATLTEAGREIASRAGRVLTEVRDIADFARQCGRPLSAPIRLGVIPTVAPYVLPSLLTRLRDSHGELELLVRETQTRTLVAELADGALDLVLLALPVDHPELETRALAEDRFLLAMPPGRRIASPVRVTADLVRNDRLLLLEEGHCLRDQALSFCKLRRIDTIDTFGASSLATIIEMVASGMGLTFLPEIGVGVEARGGRIKVARLAAPEPKRTLGLAWRRTSARKRDFAVLGEIIAASLPPPRSGTKDGAK